MARHQRGWLKQEMRTRGKTWVLFFRTGRKSDGKRVEHKVPIALVRDFPGEASARPKWTNSVCLSIRWTRAGK